MRKLFLILGVTVLVVGGVATTEASSRMSRLIKIGEEASNFFWRNKVAITTGTLLVTAASCPEVFVDGAVAMASGPPVIVQNYEAAGQKRAINWNMFVGLIGVLTLGVMYAVGGRARSIAKIVTIILLLGGVLYFSGTAWAGTGSVEAVAGRSIWSYLFDLILIILMLGIPLG